MLAFNKNQKRLPIGGHHFHDHGVNFKGETLQELAEKIVSFRAINNIPAGNPEQEILVFYAKNWPYMVIEAKGKQPKVVDDEYVAWRDSIYKRWSNPPLKFIVQSEAVERWNVCEGCPHLKPIDWPKTEEQSELVRKSFLLSRGLQTPAFLGYCALHCTDLRSIVYAESPTSQSSKKDALQPEKCWMI